MNKPINPTHENANFIYLNDLSQRRMARDLITKMIKQTDKPKLSQRTRQIKEIKRN